MYYLGIDDTDNKTSRGTGFKSRMLAAELEDNNVGRVLGITRHQLFVDPAIPYTSQNSSACLVVDGEEVALWEYGRDFLVRNNEPGSDAGICLISEEKISTEIHIFASRAKKEVLTMDEAYVLARKSNFRLEGVSGNRQGIIGALAGIGLRSLGNDGRFIWLKGIKELRSLEAGTYTSSFLKEQCNILSYIDEDRNLLEGELTVSLNDWVRPVLYNFKPTLVLKEIKRLENEWEIASKECIKSISD